MKKVEGLVDALAHNRLTEEELEAFGHTLVESEVQHTGLADITTKLEFETISNNILGEV